MTEPLSEQVWNEARRRGLAKWQAGEQEHGGSLIRKPVLAEAINEAIDQVSYLLVLQRQVDRAKVLLFDSLATGDMESVRRAANLLHFGNEEGDA